jgi:hypothetical protein
MKKCKERAERLRSGRATTHRCIPGRTAWRGWKRTGPVGDEMKVAAQRIAGRQCDMEASLACSFSLQFLGAEPVLKPYDLRRIPLSCMRCNI